MSMIPGAETAISHVLLVDDEDDCNFVTKLVLSKSGYTGRITCFTCAEETLVYLRAGRDLPDIMFVDINMPRITGFELLATCEQEQLLPNGVTSVVMFSSSNRPSDLQRALSFRSVIGFVEKALTVEGFHQVVNDHAKGRMS